MPRPRRRTTFRRSLTALMDFDEEPARHRARHRRRLRRQALRLSRGRRRGGGGAAARPLGQVDRGPARTFHQRGAGARPVLGDGDRGRRRRQGARRARQAAARHRRLCAAGRQHPLQLGLDHERALCRAGALDRGHHRHDQQDAGVVGARRRLSAGGLRHGAADGPGRARAEARPRGGAAAQSHPGGEDALPQAAEGTLRADHRIRQRRLSGLPGGGAGGRRLGRASRSGRRRRGSRAAISASAWRMASRAPAAGRSNPASCGSHAPGASPCSPALRRWARASARRWRRSRRASSA